MTAAMQPRLPIPACPLYFVSWMRRLLMLLGHVVTCWCVTVSMSLRSKVLSHAIGFS